VIYILIKIKLYLDFRLKKFFFVKTCNANRSNRSKQFFTSQIILILNFFLFQHYVYMATVEEVRTYSGQAFFSLIINSPVLDSIAAEPTSLLCSCFELGGKASLSRIRHRRVLEHNKLPINF
jgi:hypothetical protein